MKTLNRFFYAAVLLALASASQAIAQSQLSGPNGTAMSPKLQQMFWEQQRRPVAAAPATLAPRWVPSSTAVLVASPKLRQLLGEPKVSGVAQDTGTVASYQPTGADGITASPKLRQQIDEQSVQFQIAPLK